LQFHQKRRVGSGLGAAPQAEKDKQGKEEVFFHDFKVDFELLVVKCSELVGTGIFFSTNGGQSSTNFGLE